MTPAALFSVANTVALGSWLVLAIAPWRPALALVPRMAAPLLFAVAYSAIVAVHWAGSDGGFSSLAAVAALFDHPWMLLAGWIHYLAFDMLIGAWEVQDALERGVPRWLVLPCLGLTFLFGPAGWLAYVAVRTATAPSPSRSGR
jgi:hypothetical protein